jgi:hypothetical protein
LGPTFQAKDLVSVSKVAMIAARSASYQAVDIAMSLTWASTATDKGDPGISDLQQPFDGVV